MVHVRSWSGVRARLAQLSLDMPLLIVLLVGLGLRLLLWNHLPRTGWISDEGEYFSAATWLAQGRGFSWYQQYLWTRAPLYPLFLAMHLRLFGDVLAPIYVSQTILSLVNIALVYALARRLTPVSRAVPAIAALLMAVYLPFAMYPQVLLSETLFLTLLLGGFLALVRRPTTDDRRPTMGEHKSGSWSVVSSQWAIILSGLLFGLATLTRSLTLLFLPVVALWLLWRTIDERRWTNDNQPWTKQFSPAHLLTRSIAFLLAAALVIAPWTFYNSRLYGGPIVVDTSGAFNLLLGARTAYDGRRADAPTRDFVLGLFPTMKPSAPPENSACAPYPGVLPSQAARQSAMMREGLCLLASKPVAFAEKSLGELVDLFQINYSGDERFTNNFALGQLPRWYAAALFMLDDTLFVLALPLGVVGWALAKGRRQKADGRKSATVTLTGLWWAYNLAVAPLLFAINRFRLPLLPFMFIFAAYAAVALWHGGWRQLLARGMRWWSAVAAVLLLIATTPYAYLEPRAPDAPSRWASYLGPYPSSLADTLLAWQRRPAYLTTERLQAALHAGDAATAQSIMAGGDVLSYTLQFAQPLLLGVEGRYDAGLAALPSLETIMADRNWQAALVYADLLRSKGDSRQARAIFTQTFIDNVSPVQWAWDWLHPAPTMSVDVAGNLDYGYIEGCYFGEGDQSITPPANFRWCTDGMRVRFPAAGTGAPQTLVLRVDGRAWQGYAATPPTVRVLLGETDVGSFAQTFDVAEHAVNLPATPAGQDVVVTLRMPTFVPGADRYLAKQGSDVGQVQRLGVRLDWIELREAAR
jgi:4-amino-4-deoxy-L-arabinose transferase-like glycosyltransferase